MKYTAQNRDPEFRRIQEAFMGPEVQFLGLVKLYAAPANPFDGMIVYADGTTWNPGGGEGAYMWYAAAWNGPL